MCASVEKGGKDRRITISIKNAPKNEIQAKTKEKPKLQAGKSTLFGLGFLMVKIHCRATLLNVFERAF